MKERFALIVTIGAATLIITRDWAVCFRRFAWGKSRLQLQLFVYVVIGGAGTRPGLDRPEYALSSIRLLSGRPRLYREQEGRIGTTSHHRPLYAFLANTIPENKGYDTSLLPRFLSFLLNSMIDGNNFSFAIAETLA
jgi:hypothetical protein